jgi:hypothetical protein
LVNISNLKFGKRIEPTLSDIMQSIKDFHNFFQNETKERKEEQNKRINERKNERKKNSCAFLVWWLIDKFGVKNTDSITHSSFVKDEEKKSIFFLIIFWLVNLLLSRSDCNRILLSFISTKRWNEQNMVENAFTTNLGFGKLSACLLFIWKCFKV